MKIFRPRLLVAQITFNGLFNHPAKIQAVHIIIKMKFHPQNRHIKTAEQRTVIAIQYQMPNSPPINGQCTNFVLFDVAL